MHVCKLSMGFGETKFKILIKINNVNVIKQ